MFANNEKVQGVNTAEIFARMLGELPWANLGATFRLTPPS